MLKALMDFPYAGKTVRRGEYFTAVCDSDRQLLLLGERAIEDRDDGEAAADEEERHDESRRKSRRHYTRRDLRAEG